MLIVDGSWNVVPSLDRFKIGNSMLATTILIF